MTLTEIQAKAQHIQAKDAYLQAITASNTGKPIMTNAQFVKLENAIREVNPTWSKLRKTA